MLTRVIVWERRACAHARVCVSLKPWFRLSGGSLKHSATSQSAASGSGVWLRTCISNELFNNACLLPRRSSELQHLTKRVACAGSQQLQTERVSFAEASASPTPLRRGTRPNRVARGNVRPGEFHGDPEPG